MPYQLLFCNLHFSLYLSIVFTDKPIVVSIYSSLPPCTMHSFLPTTIARYMCTFTGCALVFIVCCAFYFCRLLLCPTVTLRCFCICSGSFLRLCVSLSIFAAKFHRLTAHVSAWRRFTCRAEFVRVVFRSTQHSTGSSELQCQNTVM